MAHVVEGHGSNATTGRASNGFNFILNQSLGGRRPSPRSRYDPQGKAHAPDADGLPDQGARRLGEGWEGFWRNRA